VLGSCQTAGQIVEADLGTGLNISPEQQDPHWQLIAVPPSQTGAFPAYSTNASVAWSADRSGGCRRFWEVDPGVGQKTEGLP
jgi:hypothetical protein